MSRLLDIAYVFLLAIASPWLLYRALFRNRNRRGWRQKLFGSVPVRVGERPCVWLHAVSVGEVNLLQPVIERLLQRDPRLELMISTTTETGFDLATKKYGQHTVFFCPFDFSWAIRRTLNRLRPSLIVLAELEVWPNMVSVADLQGIPVAVMNGRLSESSCRGYRKLAWLLRPVFAKLKMVAAQNQTYADRFVQLGTPPQQVAVTGNVKFDGVTIDRKNAQTQSLIHAAGIQPDDFVWVAGSTQPHENLLIARVYQKLAVEFSNLRLVLVPRHPETSDAVRAKVEAMGLPVVRRSQFPVEDDVTDQNPVLLVDVIGELSAWWGGANAAFVGGSMGGVVGGNRGGQNMIEPAAYGVPVSFGPDTRNFREIVSQLLQADAATVVEDEADLVSFMRQAITEPRWSAAVGRRAQELVRQHAGAADRTVEQLLEVLPVSQAKPARAA